MERLDPQCIGDVLRMLFQESCMQDTLDERRAIELWSKVVGENISSLCRRPEVRQGVLTVGVPNASLRHELFMNRTGIRLNINELIGKETIQEIKFIS